MNKVTVGIATRNPVKEWLQQTMDSCAGVDAIVVCNDASDMFNQFEYKYPVDDVTVLHNDTQIGAFRTFNRAASVVKEGFVSLQADDDYFDAVNFKEIIDVVRHSSADIVHFPCQYFGKYSFVFGRCPSPSFDDIYQGNNIYGASFIRKELFEFLDGYQTDVSGDWDFWLRAIKSGAHFEYYPKIGAHFRVSDRSMFEGHLQKLGRDAINAIVHENVNRWSKFLV